MVYIKFNHAVHLEDMQYCVTYRGFPGGASGKQSACLIQETLETQVWYLGWEDLLEEGRETHPSVLAWRIPWTEEPGRLQSIGLHRVGHDWSNLACMYTSMSVTSQQN